MDGIEVNIITGLVNSFLSTRLVTSPSRLLMKDEWHQLVGELQNISVPCVAGFVG